MIVCNSCLISRKIRLLTIPDRCLINVPSGRWVFPRLPPGGPAGPAPHTGCCGQALHCAGVCLRLLCEPVMRLRARGSLSAPSGRIAHSPCTFPYCCPPRRVPPAALPGWQNWRPYPRHCQNSVRQRRPPQPTSSPSGVARQGQPINWRLLCLEPGRLVCARQQRQSSGAPRARLPCPSWLQMPCAQLADLVAWLDYQRPMLGQQHLETQAWPACHVAPENQRSLPAPQA